MASEIKVDTISENTSAAGVTIDGVLIKDGQVDGVDVSAITDTNGLVKLATATASNSSTLTFDNFVDTSEYTSYKIVMEGIYGSVASTLRAYFRTSTPSDITDTYHNAYYERALEAADTDSTGKQDYTWLEIWGGQGATVDHQWNAEATLHAPSNGYGAFHITGTLKNNSDKFMFAERYSMNNTTTGIQGIRFYMSNGNIAAGTITIYGVKR